MKSLNDQLREKQIELDKLDGKNSDILIVAAKDRAEREAATKQLSDIQTQLFDVGKSLQEKSAALAKAKSDAEALLAQTESDQAKLNAFTERFAKASAAWKVRSRELADAKNKLTLAQDLIDRMKTTPGANAEDTEIMVRLAAAEAAIRQFNPSSWDEANERLLAETTAYATRLQQRQTETALGKTEKHRDIQRIDTQLDSQFRVVIEALKHRDQADRDAWVAYESQIAAQQTLREAKINEGWAATSKTVRDIDKGLAALKQGQQTYLAGKSRHEQDGYEFASWSKLAELPDINDAYAFAAFRDLKRGAKFTNSLGQVFVYLPPGTFEMGSPINETSRSDDEGKNGTHTVTLTAGIFMAVHETTQEPYQKITGEAPWKGQDYVREGADYPATYVSWDDANDKFIKRLNTTERTGGTLPTGWEYRLPTEAQWEYAARAGKQTRYSFGDDESQLGKYAWFGANAWDTGDKYAHYVGQKLPNQWGLYDMAGNVWEWTADLYGDYPTGTVTNPTGSGGSNRVGRGGGFYNISSYCRPAGRYRYSSGDRDNFLGFRLALVQVSRQ